MSSTDSENRNALFLSPSIDSGNESCINLLSASDPSDTVALLTTFTTQRSPGEWLRLWEEYAGGRPAQLKVISIGDFTRSAAQQSGPSLADTSPIETVRNPSDLTGIGIAISEILGQWDSDKWENGPSQLVFCFDSLTVLLQYADLERVFQFLHVLLARLKTVDAVTHCHLDPSAHDEQTIATLRTLFDEVIEQSELT